MSSGAAQVGRPRNALLAWFIRGVVVIGAAFAWYLLFRSVFPYFTADHEDARSGMTAAEYLAAVKDRQPDIRSEFDVYLVENRLIYVKAPCTQADVAAWFFVHVDPVSLGDLPDYRRPHGFDNFTFGFGRRGRRSGETCWADFLLPDYDVAAIRTGQYVEVEGGYRNEWMREIDLRAKERVAKMTAEEYQAALAGRQPDIRSDFDVYFVENRLIYVKEQCGPEVIGARLFVHVEPVSPVVLPDHRRPHGFDSFTFGFDQYGARSDGTCRAAFPLPDYDVAAIRTGQYVEVEGGYRNEWIGEIDLRSNEGAAKGEMDPRAKERTVKMTAEEYQAALAGRQPDIRSGFDVYFVEDRLIYVKEQCGAEDIDGWFFVHVDPVSPDVLADHRRPHGFDNLVFRFDQHGARFDGTCRAAFLLPDYDVAEIRTGQYLEVEGGFRNVWEGGIRFDIRFE